MADLSSLSTRKVFGLVILALLVLLAFFIIKPILLSIVIGFILAFIFLPVYEWLYKKTKRKNISASIVCFGLIILVCVPLWLFLPSVLNQSFKFYLAAQQIDFLAPLSDLFPRFFGTESLSTGIAGVVKDFISNTTNSAVKSISGFIIDLPQLSLQFLVVLFTFFFVLRDKDQVLSYIKSLLPFSKEVETKLFKYSKGITISVLYGQIIIGIIQGLIVGASFFIFGVPNAVFLTLLATLAGVLPIIGTLLLWVPVVVYLLVAGSTLPAVGVAVFGIVSSSIDNLLRPLFVSKMTEMPSSLVLIGMIGGLFMFGVLGLILGPLILAYLLIVVEIYRNKSDGPSLPLPERC